MSHCAQFGAVSLVNKLVSSCLLMFKNIRRNLLILYIKTVLIWNVFS